MRISEVSKKCGLSPDTLRYYERIGLIPSVNRDSSGVRDYNEKDIRWIEFIKCMRNAGLPIDALIEYVDLFLKGDETIEARKNLLIEQREKLIKKINDMQKTLELLNYKIDVYYNSMVPIENKLKKAMGE